jgi:quercetin 2,3-dioxygenase
MITIRPSEERGKVKFSWLDTKHTFSFGEYYDPNYMGFSTLRVINEDKVDPAQGFATHSHRNMEIITYIIEGELEHKDSMGNGSIIRRGDLQRMTAGKGVSHSEFNPSAQNLVHLLQIWILPDTQELEPSYEEKNFSQEEKQGKLKLVGSKDGRDNSLIIHQDVNLYTGLINNNESLDYSTSIKRNLWLQIVKGKLHLNDQILSQGDGASVILEEKIIITALEDSTEFLLFDLP